MPDVLGASAISPLSHQRRTGCAGCAGCAAPIVVPINRCARCAGCAGRTPARPAQKAFASSQHDQKWTGQLSDFPAGLAHRPMSLARPHSLDRQRFSYGLRHGFELPGTPNSAPQPAHNRSEIDDYTIPLQQEVYRRPRIPKMQSRRKMKWL